MTDLTESDKKLLTEFIGEEWNTIENSWGNSDGMPHNRTFTTPDDQHVVFKKLVDSEKWEKFYIAMRNNFCKDYITVCSRDLMEADFNVYLFINPERFCKLVSEYLKMVRNSFNEGNKMTPEKLKLIYSYMGWCEKCKFCIPDHHHNREVCSKDKSLHLLDSNSAWECAQEIERRGEIDSFELLFFDMYLKIGVDDSKLFYQLNPTNFFTCFGKWLEERESKP